MAASHEAERDLDAYARLTVALNRAGADRDRVLATHGLDEAGWQAVDDLWQARLSAAMDEGTDEVPVPPFLDDFSRAMERAQSDDVQVMSFERFLEATRAVRQGGEIDKALAALGVTRDDYLRANRHWMRRMTQDDELATTFQRALA